jgi:hypothetical protein
VEEHQKLSTSLKEKAIKYALAYMESEYNLDPDKFLDFTTKIYIFLKDEEQD